MSAVLLGWIATSFLLGSSIFMIPFGKLGDLYGRKKFFLSGVFIYGISSLSSIFSYSDLFLIITRAIQGISAAMFIGTSIGILLSAYPSQKRGFAIGINTASVYIGLSTGPFIGGLLTNYFNWRAIFLINIIISAFIIFLAFIYIVDEINESNNKKFDIAGSVIFGISLTLLIYGFSELPSLRGIIVTSAGLLCTIVFIVWESLYPAPMLNVSMFVKNKVFGLSNLTACINYSATYSITFFLSLYLQYLKDFNPQTAGLILITQPLIQSISSPFAGKLSDKVDPRYLASAGMALITAGLVLISFFNQSTSIYLIVMVLFFLGLGFGLFSSPNTNSVMTSVERKDYGIASATLGTMRQVGQMLSMGIAMILFAIMIGKTKISKDQSVQFLYAMKIGFIIFSLLCFVGIFTSMARGNNIKDNK
jgi:EmrB/QacA subfamily drug resistance transporter